MKARVLSQAQRETLEDLLTIVEMHETKLRAALPGALGQILEALGRCKDADL
jgi:hypothetical protein